MKNIFLALSFMTLLSAGLSAQVPVREEPKHHNVFQNKYIRLLDVWIQPGDTTLYHIHATPSLFVILSNTFTGSQIKGEQWIKGSSVAGTTWYRSFSPDTLVHRVANFDTVAFHVNDIEILSSFGNYIIKPLPFPLLFENENAYSYLVTDSTISQENIQGRGPLIAELIEGKNVYYHDSMTNQSTAIEAGKYLYITPGASFHFIAGRTGKFNMVLFEIK
jgi:hypothetical protein